MRIIKNKNKKLMDNGKSSWSVSRRALAFLMIVPLVMTVFSTPILVSSTFAQDGGSEETTVVDNPELPQQCSVDVQLILDHSNSILNDDQSNPEKMKTAAKNFVDDLAGSGTQQYHSSIGVISFWSVADTEQKITKLDTQENITAVKNVIDSIEYYTDNSKGLTNWEAAFLEASKSQSVTVDPKKPADLVIILTDGRPSAYGYPKIEGTSEEIGFERGIEAANVVKNEGTSIVAVGIGNIIGENSLKMITDGSSSVEGDDYYLTDFSRLSAKLQSIADELNCNIDIQKLADKTLIESGSTVNYTYEISNLGSVSLSNVQVTDDKIQSVNYVGGDDGDNLLESGEVWTYEASSQLTEDTTNLGTVIAYDSENREVIDTDSVTVTVGEQPPQDITPVLEVTKTADTDGNGVYEDPALAESGATVEFKVEIKNNGNNSFTITSVNDSIYGDVCSADIGVSVGPGQTHICTFSATLPNNDNINEINIVTVEVTGDDSQSSTDSITTNAITVSGSDDATVRVPDILPDVSVVKLNDANKDSNYTDDEEANVGETYTYKVEIINNEDEDITINGLSDTHHTLSQECSDLIGTTLGAGQTASCTFEGVINSYDTVETNTFTADVSDDDNNDDSFSDTTKVTTPIKETGVCSLTIGYWKTHTGFYGNNPDMVTEHLPLWLGDNSGTKSVEVTDVTTAHEILSMKYDGGKQSNGITKLYAQLLAAKLNVENGASTGSDTMDVINDADAFLANHDQQDWNSLTMTEKSIVLGWAEALDKYNNHEENCTEPGREGRNEDDDEEGDEGRDDEEGDDEEGDEGRDDEGSDENPVVAAIIGNDAVLSFEELQNAISYWITGETVSGTSMTLGFEDLQEIITLWSGR